MKNHIIKLEKLNIVVHIFLYMCKIALSLLHVCVEWTSHKMYNVCVSVCVCV